MNVISMVSDIITPVIIGGFSFFITWKIDKNQRSQGIANNASNFINNIQNKIIEEWHVIKKYHGDLLWIRNPINFGYGQPPTTMPIEKENLYKREIINAWSKMIAQYENLDLFCRSLYLNKKTQVLYICLECKKTQKNSPQKIRKIVWEYYDKFTKNNRFTEIDRILNEWQLHNQKFFTLHKSVQAHKNNFIIKTSLCDSCFETNYMKKTETIIKSLNQQFISYQ